MTNPPIKESGKLARMHLWMISILSFLVNSLVPSRVLFSKQKNDKIFYAYIDPNIITKTSLISEKSKLLVGTQAVTGATNGLWGGLVYNFKHNIIYKLCYELINRKNQGLIYNYVCKHHSEEEAERIWEKLHRFKIIFEEGKYKSQFELDNLGNYRQVGRYKLPKNETYVGLNKNGEFIRLVSGRHRLALSQQLHIKEIPVIITIHHPEAKKHLPIKCRVIKGCANDFLPFD